MSFRKRMPAIAAGAFLAFSPIIAAAQPASALSADEQYLVDSVNAARAAKGLAPLTYSEQLSLIAYSHSVDMSDAGSLYHSTDLAGSVGSVYPNWSRIGENVGRGATIEEINAALLASPDHAANIYGDFNLLGVGVYTNPGGVMWVTEVFAKAVVDSAVTTTDPAPAPAPVVSSPVVSSPVVEAAPTTSTVSGAVSGLGKADRAARAGATARRASASASASGSAMGAARGARGVPRLGPPAWAQNERSNR